MGNTAGEIASALNAVEALLPIAEAFLPAAAQPWLALVGPLVNAADAVAADTGKPLNQVIQDVINHLTPGAPGAPSLS